jgi:hypothetical protein
VGKLQRLIEAWDRLMSTFIDAPTTCKEWCRKMKEATGLLQKMPGQVPRLPSSSESWDSGQKAKYTSLWTFRCVMSLRMQQAGVKRLKVDDLALARFCRMNPDQGTHLVRLFHANRATIHTIRDLLQHCGAQRPELLSMELCLANDRGLDRVDFENIDVESWVRAKDDLRQRHGMCPHIACIAKKVLKQNASNVQCPATLSFETERCRKREQQVVEVVLPLK